MVGHSYSFVVSAVLCIIINVITTSALNYGYEQMHTYSYRATASVGVKWHVSEFEIDGYLKIQRIVQRGVSPDKFMLLLTNLTYTTDYGEQYVARIYESPSTIDNHVLQSPFYITYDDDGMFKSIEYQTVEPEWSQKIKKSIVHLLQFDWVNVKEGLFNEKSSKEFNAEETTMHGKCNVHYRTSGKNRFTRNYDLSSCKGFTGNVDGYLTNDEHTKKAIEDTNKWREASNHKRYVLDVVSEVPIIKLVTSVENYEYSDNIHGVAFIKDNRPLIVKLSQYLTFNGTSAEENVFDDIQHIPFQEDYPNKMKAKGLVDRIMKLLVDALTYMETNHLEMLDRGEEHRQVFNKILSTLKRLDSSDFDDLESKIREDPNSDKIRKILVQVLPYVATEHSIRFMLDAISKKTISDDLAINFFTVSPNYAKRSATPIEQLESFLNNITVAPSAVSAKVYESAILSFSHLLNRIGQDDRIANRYMDHILRAFMGAKTISSKLTFLSAIVNVRDKGAVEKHALPILAATLTWQDDEAKDQDRLRLAAINILNEMLAEVYSLNSAILDIITTILKDKSGSRSIRLAAYDLVVSRSDYAINVLSDIGNMLSDDKDLYNYHLSTIEGLQQVGVVNGLGRTLLNPSEDSASYSLSKSMMFMADNVMKSNILKNRLNIISDQQAYLKLSLVYEDQSSISEWQIPSVVKLEVFDWKDKKLTLDKACYFYTNFKGMDVGREIFFDSLAIFRKNSRIYYSDSVEFKNFPNPLDLSDVILKKIHQQLSFAYNDLTTFSLPTGVGIDAVFEHKYPYLYSTLVDYNWKVEDNSLEAKIDFSLQGWSNGYSGVSMYNPISGQTHSMRKTQEFDSMLKMSLIVKYDFSKNQLNLTVPIYVDESDAENCGIALYTSTSVGITDVDDETSCGNCGFQMTTQHVPVSLKFRRTDFHGLLLSTMPYNCDLQNLDIKNFIGMNEDGNVVNSCGFIAMMRPNTSKPFSQIELLFNYDVEESKSWEKPWYFLPGYKLYFDMLIAKRQIIANNVDHLLKLYFNASSSQGHFSNLLRFKFVKKNDEYSNFIVCFEGKVNFPEIDDNHLPTEVTQSKLNAFSRVVMGHSEYDVCSAIDFFVDFNVTGEVSDMQKKILENYASDSHCAKQKSNPLYLYPRGLYPLTEDCIREMISNTTLRRYRLDLSSEMFSEFSLLQALLIIRSTQEKVKEMAVNSHNANVEVQMTSPISEIRSTRKMSFLADYPVPNNFKNLPNIYFSQDFLLNFIDKGINVINVYPKIMVYNNEEKPFPSTNGWNEICTGIDKMQYKIYAHVLADNVMSLKILYNNYELIVKPKLVSRGTIDSNESLYNPEIYYNQKHFSDFDQRLHLFSSKEILFSLSRVYDDYVVIRSTEIPITIYYTTNSISILQNK